VRTAITLGVLAAMLAATGVEQRVVTATMLETLRVQGAVHVIVGGGANVVVQVGPLGAVVVDSGAEEHATAMLAAIRAISDTPIRFIVNTHAHPDHAGANERLAAAGAGLGNRAVATVGSGEVGRPEIIAHELVLSSLVFFRRSDVIAAGDLYSTESYPVIDVEQRGTITGVLAGLNRLLALAISGEKVEGGTMIVPGHGRVSDEADLVEYRDMVTIVRDRVDDLVRRGMTLAQVMSARPTLEYDALYGRAPGWTADQFVEAVYRTSRARR
jgi:cyclase